jgi:succinyl-CoA synthetase beta subunit
MAALGRLYGSDGPSRRSSQSAPADPTQLPAVIGEDEGRDLLTAAGLPVVPGAMVADIDAASIVAARAPGPWVLKVGVPGVAHKGKVGGVKVGLWGETAVREAAEQIARAAIAAGLVDETAEVPFLMQEMHLGPEILLGAIRDEIAGPSLTVSLGGWAAEAATPFGVVSLPLSDEELAMQMGGWQLGHFLGTEKESQLIEYATGLSRAFVSGGSLSIFTVVEINPLILGPDGAVAADVLIVR